MDMEPTEVGHGASERLFVGRERELAALRAGLESRGQARERFFLIGGEQGVGKTRLCEELAAVARAGGCHVLVGRCTEAESAPDYAPWRQALLDYVRTADAADLARDLGGGASLVAQLVPEIAERLGKETRPAASAVFSTEAAQFALFDSVAQFLDSAARSRRLLLVLEDLHAADAASLMLLRFVVRRSRDAALTIVATYRGFELGPEAARLIGELTLDGQSLPLGGLAEADVSRLVEAAAGRAPRGELVRSLHRRSAGNPSYLEALLGALAVDGGFAVAEAEAVARLLPDSVRESIRRRVVRLSGPCIEALQVASTLGLEFDVGAVARVSTEEVTTMRTRLEEAITAGLLIADPEIPAGLSFSHALVRETLHDDLLLARRLGAGAPAADAGSRHVALPRPLRTAGCFFVEGEYWTVEYEGTIVRLKDTVGLRCIAHLLRHQNQQIPARELARVAGAGGRATSGIPGAFGDERARLAVTQRIKAALRKIAAVHPTLCRHLRASIRTGYLCAYAPRPEQPVSWLL